VRAKAEAKLIDVHQEIQDLARIKRVFTGLAASCEGVGSSVSCFILTALDDGSVCDTHD
jgi:hypothetical protein